MHTFDNILFFRPPAQGHRGDAQVHRAPGRRGPACLRQGQPGPGGHAAPPRRPGRQVPAVPQARRTPRQEYPHPLPVLGLRARQPVVRGGPRGPRAEALEARGRHEAHRVHGPADGQQKGGHPAQGQNRSTARHEPVLKTFRSDLTRSLLKVKERVRCELKRLRNRLQEAVLKTS